MLPVRGAPLEADGRPEGCAPERVAAALRGAAARGAGWCRRCLDGAGNRLFCNRCDGGNTARRAATGAAATGASFRRRGDRRNGDLDNWHRRCDRRDFLDSWNSFRDDRFWRWSRCRSAGAAAAFCHRRLWRLGPRLGKCPLRRLLDDDLTGPAMAHALAHLPSGLGALQRQSLLGAIATGGTGGLVVLLFRLAHTNPVPTNTRKLPHHACLRPIRHSNCRYRRRAKAVAQKTLCFCEEIFAGSAYEQPSMYHIRAPDG